MPVDNFILFSIAGGVFVTYVLCLVAVATPRAPLTKKGDVLEEALQVVERHEARLRQNAKR